MLNRMGHNNIRILLIVTLALQAQGAISFRAGRDQLLTGPPGPNAIAVADFNGDGHLDQAAVGFGEAVVYILLGEGNGRFRQVEAIPVGLNPVSIVTGDFNGDGNPDLAVGSEGAVSVLIGNGDGTFQAPVTYLKNVGNATAITSGDFNGDGKLDLAVAIGNNNYVYVRQRRSILRHGCRPEWRWKAGPGRSEPGGSEFGAVHSVRKRRWHVLQAEGRL
jgi:hypothetical protein